MQAFRSAFNNLAKYANNPKGYRSRKEVSIRIRKAVAPVTRVKGLLKKLSIGSTAAYTIDAFKNTNAEKLKNAKVKMA